MMSAPTITPLPPATTGRLLAPMRALAAARFDLGIQPTQIGDRPVRVTTGLRLRTRAGFREYILTSQAVATITPGRPATFRVADLQVARLVPATGDLLLIDPARIGDGGRSTIHTAIVDHLDRIGQAATNAGLAAVTTDNDGTYRIYRNHT